MATKQDLEMLKLMIAIFGPRERDLHKHKCTRCFHVWEHMTPPPEASEAEYRAQHMCPKGCGLDIRLRYED